MSQVGVRNLLLLAGLGVALAVGCGKSKPAPVNPPPAMPTNGPEPGVASPPMTPPVKPTSAAATPIAYTLEPITIGSEVAPDAAHQQMVAHYGHNRVVRIVLNFTDGAAPPQTSDWLRGLLHFFAVPGIQQSSHISQQGETATATIGPVRDVGLLHAFPSRSPAEFNLDRESRTLSGKLPMAYIPPADGSPEETAELAKRAETLSTSKDFQTKLDANHRLKDFRTPAGAATFVTLMLDRMRNDKSDWIDYLPSLRNFGPHAEGFLLDWLPEGKEKGVLNKAYVIGQLAEFGGPASVEQLPKMTSLSPEEAAAAQEVIAQIKERRQVALAKENQARLDEDTSPPAALSRDTSLTITASKLRDSLQANREETVQKYDGKLVEITGDLKSLGYGWEENGQPKLELATNSDSIPAKLKVQHFPKTLAPGMRVTIKGKLAAQMFLELKDAEVLKVDGPPPTEVTAEAFGAEHGDPAKLTQTNQELSGKWMVLTGKILEVQGSGNFAILETGTEPKAYVALNLSQTLKKQLRVGQTLVTLVKFSRNNGRYLSFEDGVLCAALPEVQPVKIAPPRKTPSAVPPVPAAYTLEPITIGPEVAVDDAWEKMVAHYGNNRVGQVVLHFNDGPAPPQTADWLRGIAPFLATPGLKQSSYVNLQDNTATLIVGPVRDMRSKFGILFIWDPPGRRQFDSKTRTWNWEELPTSFIPPPPGSPEEKDALAKIAETLSTSMNFDARVKARRRLENFRSPAAAATYCTLMIDALGEEKEGAFQYLYELKAMGPQGERCVLDWLPAGEEKGKLQKASIIAELGEFGDAATAELLPKLTTLPPEALEAAQAAIAKIEKRQQVALATEARARQDDENPHPPAITKDVSLTINARTLREALDSNWKDIFDKYNGRIVEVSGELERVDYDYRTAEPTLNFRTNTDIPISARLPGKHHLKTVAPGMRVTIKGKAVQGESYLYLKESDVVKSEEPPPPVMTAEALGSFFADPNQRAERNKKYADKWVVITGKVLNAKGPFTILETGTRANAQLSWSLADELRKDLKEGQTLTVLGQFRQHTGRQLIVENCVLCAAPQDP
ncbi:OB-fold putative lipoprotein [Anatilimnocola floriformis]|uniref:OB-fold putative lipoprotein n=1 Tax=Anatilimnocola floriformis TaxID=2948575 RepID=UPI0020C207B7|nr:OB-fold putative lipoprotein [Anatilimnocola floriformis]